MNSDAIRPKQSGENVVNKGTERENREKCKFYNAGFCKYKLKNCRFVHPEYLKSMKCEIKDCLDRHPKICKLTKKIKVS